MTFDFASPTFEFTPELIEEIMAFHKKSQDQSQKLIIEAHLDTVYQFQ